MSDRSVILPVCVAVVLYCPRSLAHDGELTNPRAREAATKAAGHLRELASRGKLTPDGLAVLDEICSPFRPRTSITSRKAPGWKRQPVRARRRCSTPSVP